MHRDIFFLANVSKPEPAVESIFTGMVVVALENFVVCNVNTKHCLFFYIGASWKYVYKITL